MLVDKILSGWDGVLCDRPCPDGSFGKNCEGKCQCLNNAACDPQNGKQFFDIILSLP